MSTCGYNAMQYTAWLTKATWVDIRSGRTRGRPQGAHTGGWDALGSQHKILAGHHSPPSASASSGHRQALFIVPERGSVKAYAENLVEATLWETRACNMFLFFTGLTFKGTNETAKGDSGQAFLPFSDTILIRPQLLGWFVGTSPVNSVP